MTEFSRLFVATLTPFDSAGRVDLGVIRAHTEWLLEAGVSGICPCGTTGEWIYLSVGEKARIVQTAVVAASGRAKVIAGISAIHATDIILLARSAESSGADALFMTPPIYYPTSDSVIVEHYRVVRAASSLPLFAYNIPSHAVNSIGIECLDQLTGEGIISGIKDSTGDSARMQSLVNRFSARIRVLGASDSFASKSRSIGAHGFVSALANIWPDAFVRLWAGDSGIQPVLDTARAAVKSTGGIPALKHLAALRGFQFGPSRIPPESILLEDVSALEKAFRVAKASGLS